MRQIFLSRSTTLSGSLGQSDTTITVADATSFPKNGGYIKIDDEICFYAERTDTQFLEVSRGVSGNTTIGDLYTKSTFVTTQSALILMLMDQLYRILVIYFYIL